MVLSAIQSLYLRRTDSPGNAGESPCAGQQVREVEQRPKTDRRAPTG